MALSLNQLNCGIDLTYHWHSITKSRIFIVVTVQGLGSSDLSNLSVQPSLVNDNTFMYVIFAKKGTVTFTTYRQQILNY